MTSIGFWKPFGRYGFLSQWFFCSFEEGGVKFICAEQYMMYHKAKFFDDMDTAGKVLRETDPSRMKALGRMIRNFDDELWTSAREGIVYRGNLLKFSSDENLKRRLLETGDAILVEASPYDRIWGIGQTNVEKPWNGENLLGYILMDVRDELK